MNIFVKAKPNAKENSVVPPPPRLIKDAGEEWYVVSVKEPPKEGRANTAVMKLLAGYFKVAVSQIQLVSGAASKRKVFRIKE